MVDLAVALDLASEAEAMEIVGDLGEDVGCYKVGLQLYTREGPGVVEALRRRGKRIFLDLKLHDIPNTVYGTVEAARAIGVEFLTLHLSGGGAMLRAARDAAGPELRLLGVTVLTSLDRAGLGEVWGREVRSVTEDVVRLAGLGAECGIDGVVASAREARALKSRIGPELFVATPGIRLPEGLRHDQARVTTPADAVAAGSDLLVLGRAVTGASEPRRALARIKEEMLEGRSVASGAEERE